jgi:diguanylate cyclase (GGDEF)-like protein
MTVCMVAIGWSAIRLHKIDGARARGDATISTLTEGIEGMAQERTARLAQLSKALNENRSLELLSHEDGLTKLANRRRFDSHLASQVALARRKRQTLSLILFDVDAFKAFNDQYGHPAGDECLKQVAAVLKSSCRRPSDLAARYGGEEFALILPDTEAIGAIRIAEDVRRAVAQLKIPHAHSPAGPFVSICGGVSVFMAQLNISEEQLIHRADEALFEAKRTGRNRIVSLRDQAA